MSPTALSPPTSPAASSASSASLISATSSPTSSLPLVGPGSTFMPSNATNANGNSSINGQNTIGSKAGSTMPVVERTVPTSDTFRQSLIAASMDILAGTAGGVATVLVGHPLDTIKVRVQNSSSATLELSMTSVIRTTIKEEGFTGFYKGMQSPLIGEGFFNAVQFFAYGAFKRTLETMRHRPTDSNFADGADSHLTIPDYFILGAATGFAVSFVESPIDLFKSQLQVQTFHPENTPHSAPLFTTLSGGVSYVYRVGGIRGCFQGLGATFLRSVPGSAFYFGSYEYSKRMLRKYYGVEELSANHLLVSGGIAGVSYWLSSFPFDSIKSKIQCDSVVQSERKYTGIPDVAKQLYREGGIARFYRGLTPCMIRAFPANAACFFAYEYTIKFLKRLQ